MKIKESNCGFLYLLVVGDPNIAIYICYINLLLSFVSNDRLNFVHKIDARLYRLVYSGQSQSQL